MKCLVPDYVERLISTTRSKVRTEEPLTISEYLTATRVWCKEELFDSVETMFDPRTFGSIPKYTKNRSVVIPLAKLVSAPQGYNLEQQSWFEVTFQDHYLQPLSYLKYAVSHELSYNNLAEQYIMGRVIDSWMHNPSQEPSQFDRSTTTNLPPGDYVFQLGRFAFVLSMYSTGIDEFCRPKDWKIRDDVIQISGSHYFDKQVKVHLTKKFDTSSSSVETRKKGRKDKINASNNKVPLSL